MSAADRWSAQQRAIFDWFATGRGHLVVRARAGTGKTTTIVEALAHASGQPRAVLCAFNKSIAEELGARLRQPAGGQAEAKTLHALGFAAVRARRKGVRVEGQRGKRLAEQAGASKADAPTAAKLAGLAKSLYCGVPSREELQCLAESRGFETDSCPAGRVAEYARWALEAALADDGEIDFDDMVWLPVAQGWVTPQYDLVVIDECQDMSSVQIALARGLCRAGGRIVAVGDDRQAIYGFRGADSGSLDRLRAELGATELGLTTTYRCGRTIVAAAAALVPDFVAADGCHEGAISEASREALLDGARAGDFILSRVNAPLASICLALLRAGQPAIIAGRDIGAGLVALVRKLAGKATGLEDFQSRLDAWKGKELARLDALAASGKDVDARAEFLHDQYDTIVELAAGLQTTVELAARIEALFGEPESGTRKIVCSSVHRSKGLEADRVWVLKNSWRRKGGEEDNLRYVAITRAKRELVWVP